MVVAGFARDRSWEIRMLAFESLREVGDSRWTSLATEALADAEDTVGRRPGLC